MNELLSKFQAEAERLARADRRAHGAVALDTWTTRTRKKAATRERHLRSAADRELDAQVELLKARRISRSK